MWVWTRSEKSLKCTGGKYQKQSYPLLFVFRVGKEEPDVVMYTVNPTAPDGEAGWS